MQRVKSRSKKRRKTQTTRAYRKTEKEVQQLLFQSSKNSAEHKAGVQELEERSLEFFHGSNVNSAKDEYEPINDDTSATDTFIQIELTDPPLIWPFLYRQAHYYDKSLLWTPESRRLNLPLQLSDFNTKLNCFQVRMLNRYQEEARSQHKGKLNATLIAQFMDTNSIGFILDKQLYRSYSLREFKTIFITPVPLAKFQGLPVISHCLRMHLKQLRFSAHPLLLEEHRLAQQLEDLYDLYAQQVNSEICDKLRQELQIARNVLAGLINVTNQQDPAEPVLASCVQKQLELTQQLRQRYYAESTAQRILLQRLLKNWAKLKELRSKQQFQCTSFKLSLQLMPPENLDAACSLWKQRFETDLAEVYREELELYHQRRFLWSNGKQSPRSKPPRKPQFSTIMDNLKMQYERAFADPEEPAVHVLRLPNNESTTCPPPGSKHDERSYYLKIYLDGQFVAQTRCYRLEPDMYVHMNESIGVLLDRSLPEQINIWLYEKSTITSQTHRLAMISSPQLTLAKGESSSLKLEFQVTSDTRSKLAGDLYLHIDYRYTDENCSCELDDIQVLPNELKQQMLPVKLPERNITPTEAIPQAPYGRAKNKSGKSTEPLIFAEHQLQFCSFKELLENTRFQLLRSRHQQRNLHTKHLRFVPTLEHELDELKDMNGPHFGHNQLIDPGNIWNPIDLHKHRGRKFLQLLYNSIISYCSQRAKLLQTSHPVLQLQGPDGKDQSTSGWSGIWRALRFRLFGATATMTPSREPAWQPQPTCALDQMQQFTISLHVVRATGVPVRSRHIVNVEQPSSSSRQTTNSDISTNLFVTQTLMYSNVRPFVTLSFGQRLCRSGTAEGSNPTWNEQLRLQITARPLDLHDDVKISLFDEVIEQQFTDEAADLYQRLQCNWLGEYCVPIASLLTNRKFEGCIELTMPKVLVGYKRPLIESVTNISVEHYPEFKESVHLWYFLSVEPSIEPLPIQVASLACAELPELQQYVAERRVEVQQLLLQPHRYVEPLICTSQGKRVCLTRLLEPVPLPNDMQQLEMICRFVSLLTPMRSEMAACQSFQGIWLDNQALLDSTWCTVKDLGVLLCNYMLSLKLECWLLLGLACPYGECTFVIYRQPESNDLMLLAPTTGKCYQLQDTFCPLTRVHCIVNTQNMFINIQAEERVSMTNFNLHDATCWLPLFNKRQVAPQGGIQKLDYVYKRTYDLEQLQKQIERKIMKKISAWRTTRKTIWNRAFQPRLLKILKDMENLAIYAGNRYDEPAYSEELEREYPNFRLYGFTINFPYTNLPAISERIRTTCIHYNNTANVEFCVAVHINGYTNDVLSVWVFLLSIIPLVG